MSFGEGNLRTAVAELQEENRALRQLVLQLFGTMNTLRVNGHAPTGRQLDHYEQRMRELGIEVDR